MSRRSTLRPLTSIGGGGEDPGGTLVPVNQIPPAVYGEVAVFNPLTADVGTWSNTPTSYEFQWQEEDVDAGIVPSNITPPTVSGEPKVGVTLTATTGSWSENPTQFQYKWEFDDTALPGVPTIISNPQITAPPVVGTALNLTSASWGGTVTGIETVWERETVGPAPTLSRVPGEGPSGYTSSDPFHTGTSPTLTPPAGLRKLYVAQGGSSSGAGTDSTAPISWARAWQLAQPGDEIVITTDLALGAEPSRSVSGTAELPIYVVGNKGGGATPRITATSAHVLHFYSSAYIGFYNINVDAQSARTWGFCFGRRYDTDPTSGFCHHIDLWNVEIHHTLQAGLSIKGGGASKTNHVNVFGCHIHDTGYTTSDQYYGEGIYLGDGNTAADWCENVWVEWSEIGNIIGGEAIDVKNTPTNINIEHNWIHDVEVGSQGAITAWNVDSLIIDYNLFYNIRKFENYAARGKVQSYNGDAIQAGGGSMFVRYNIGWQIGGAVFRPMGRRTGNNLATVANNTGWATGLTEGVTASFRTDHDTNHGTTPPTITWTNLVGVGTPNPSGTHAATSANFIGPLTTTASIGGLPGRGFKPSTSTTIPSGYGAMPQEGSEEPPPPPPPTVSWPEVRDYISESAPSFTPVRTINVSTITAIQNAINAAQPGDDIVITAGGTLTGRIDITRNLAGYARLRCADGVTTTIKCPTSGNRYTLYIRSSNRWIIGSRNGNLRLDGSAYTNGTVGIGLFSGTKQSTSTNGLNPGQVQNTTFINVEIFESRYALVKCGYDSRFIKFINCKFHDSGISAQPGYGEGLYIGSASGTTDTANNIEVLGCDFTKIAVESIDLKQNTHTVTIDGCSFHDITMVSHETFSKGAIANRTTGGNIVVRNTRFWNLKRGNNIIRDGTYVNDPCGIYSDGPITIERCIFWNCEREAIWSTSGTSKAVHCTFWNNGNPLASNRTATISGGSFSFEGCIYPSGSLSGGTAVVSGTCVNTDFVGPLTGAAKNVYAGDGFELRSTSSHVDAITARTPYDLRRIAAPQGANGDRGALERPV